MNKLVLPALRTFLIGAVLLGIVLFLPAWTLNYWQGWVFILVFLISVNIIGLYLALKDPELLERRKKFGPAQEQSPAQKVIMSFALVSLIGMLVFCALDHRFGWSPVPGIISVIGDGLVALGLFVNLLVFRENSYGGSTIDVAADQIVITTGLYGHIRHPMYLGVLVMVLGVPLALGSWWGLLVLAVTLPMLIWRILDEERMLVKDLPGYDAYAQKVRYRLVPHLW